VEKLLKNKLFVISLAVAVLIFGGLVIAWQSALYTLNHMSFKEVTPTYLAAAMRQDEFWSSNRFNTLVFDGKVKSVNTDGNKTTLEFVNSDTYSTSCDLYNSSTKFKVSETYKFAAETYQAERQPNGVLLHNCILA
jgi:6-phosphogluconolactonase (cycloisomerase 2 family)